MSFFLPSFQLQFPWDVIDDQNTSDLRMLISFLGVPAQDSPRAQARPRPIPGPDPNDMRTLCVQGRSVLYHARNEGPRALGGGWLQGQAAGAAAIQPCVHPKWQQLREQQLSAFRTQAEGCKYTSPS